MSRSSAHVESQVMLDPCLTSAIALVNEAHEMSTADAVRHIFDRYRTAAPDAKEAIVMALIAALNVARLRSGVRP